MPSYTPCTGCGRPCKVTATMAASGPLCRKCRRPFLCARCGQPHLRRWSPFCSTACGRAYQRKEAS